MKYACPQCGTVYDLSVEHYNQNLECQCGAKFAVPGLKHSPDKGGSIAIFPLVVMITASILACISLCFGIFCLSAYLKHQDAIVALNLFHTSFDAFFVSLIIIILSYIAAKVSQIAGR